MITVLPLQRELYFPTLNFRRPDEKRFSQAPPLKSLTFHLIYHLQQKKSSVRMACVHRFRPSPEEKLFKERLPS